VWGWLSLFAPAWVQPWQERITDAVWRLGSQARDERRLIIIDIDERSLREVGPWPWPRAVQAELLHQLQQQGTALQILDIVFADARPGDEQLQRALAQHSPVLAQVFALPGQGDKTTAGQLAGALDWSHCPVPFSEASGYLGNAPGLLTASSNVGHITPRLSSDGVNLAGIQRILELQTEVDMLRSQVGALLAEVQRLRPSLGARASGEPSTALVVWRPRPADRDRTR